jgi:hypothetical protein
MIMIIPVDPRNNYWTVGGSQLYFSGKNIYVPTSDADYVTWLESHSAPHNLADEAELWGVISNMDPSYLPDWLFDGTTFVQPAEGVYSTMQLKSYTTFSRWKKEQGGLTLTSGKPIKTDDRSQAKINGAKLMAIDKTTTYNPFWHFADDSIAQLAATDVINMSNDLQTHIDHCFTISAQTKSEIDAGTVTTLAQIDAAFA